MTKKKRIAHIHRSTKETKIKAMLDLDGRGESNIQTGSAFSTLLKFPIP